MIQLKHDVYHDCTQPRIRLLHQHNFPGAFYAVWTCNLDLASDIYFSKSHDIDAFPSRQWGALYFALTKESTHKQWYCLSKRTEDWPEEDKIRLVGQSVTLEPHQTVFVEAKNKQLCATLYLGNRDYGEYSAMDGVGFSEVIADRFVIGEPGRGSEASVLTVE